MESRQLSTDAGSLNREEYPGIEERVSGEIQEKNKAQCSRGGSLPDKFGQHL